MTNEGGFCQACGDPGYVFFKGRRLCATCFDELAFGIIDTTPANLHLFGGQGTMDDISPWQEIVIRQLEDAHDD